MNTATSPHLVYVGDPMCSWCWGFAPVLERLVGEHDLGLRIVLGGLRPGPSAQPLSEDLKAYLLHHWVMVAEASGQPFDHSGLEARDGSWLYDTELPAIAVTAMRAMHPDAALHFFFAVQEAFYAHGIDITKPEAYPSLVEPFNVDPDDFAAQLADTECRRRAWDDFSEARRLGATGFPTTLLAIDGRYRMLAAGYRPYAEVDQILHAALDRLAPADVVGATCSLDGAC